MRITADDQAALGRLAERSDDLVSRAVGWCAINSGSRNFEGLERQREALEEALSALPGRLERVPLQASEIVRDDGCVAEQPHPDALRLTLRSEAPVQVVMTGHYDTVYPATSLFQTVRVRDDGALHGPGIADMKGGISAALGAIEALETHPLRNRVGVRLLLSPDEEIGSPASAPVLAGLAKGAHVGLTYEPAMADGALAGARKGSANFHLVVTGRAAHAGRDFASGRNAVAEAARIGTALHAMNGRRDGVTVNVAAISGGGPLNVVADNAVVRFNARVPDQAAAEWVEAEVRALAAAPSDGLTLRLHGGFTRPPKPMDSAQTALFGAVKDAGALLGHEIAWRPSGGVCEGNNLYAAGLPNVDTLGVVGGDIHSEAEWARPESFVERAQLSALILFKLASGEIDGPGLRALRDGVR